MLIPIRLNGGRRDIITDKCTAAGELVQECWSQADWRINLRERARVLGIIRNVTGVFRLVCCSANAVSSRDGLDTETGTESLLSHRRERERERARRRARETEREYDQTGEKRRRKMQLSRHCY